jgi:hypothetical protein
MIMIKLSLLMMQIMIAEGHGDVTSKNSGKIEFHHENIRLYSRAMYSFYNWRFTQ